MAKEPDRSVVFVDTNIFMYAGGAEGSYRVPCIEFLKQVRDGDIYAVTNTEVIQEILYRYSKIGKREVGVTMARSVIGLVSKILPVTQQDIDQMIKYFVRFPRLSARDAVHLACMKTHEIGEIVSLDHDFDEFPWIRRQAPPSLSSRSATS